MQLNNIQLSRLFFTCIAAGFIITGLAGCSKNDATGEDGSGSGSGTVAIDQTAYTSGTAEGSTETGADEDDLVENSTFSGTVSIVFGSTVTITNPLSASGVSITQTGSDVVITSTVKEVEYVLSGATTDGSVKIYSDNKFKLTLNGVSITNADGPAINIQSSKRAFIVLADNTTSSLADGATYATATNEEDMKGTLFSEGQIIFSGTGSLTVKGNYKHAICSDDYVRVRSGNITISGAATDGIHTNDAFIADGGTLSVKASSDGIEAEEGFIIINDGTFTLDVADDGIAASYEESDESITPYVNINGGTIRITTTEGEGIESKSVLTINDGDISMQTVDDGLNAGDAIYINGGTVYAYSTGNDAMDSNGTFTVTGGKVIAIGARSPEAGIDCDARAVKITGGLVIGTGGATSAPGASVSTTYSVIMGGGNANQIIHIEDASGKEVLTFLSPATYTTMLFASTKLNAATTYKVYTGGSVASGEETHGVYTSGTYTKGTSSASFTTNSVVTQIGGTISRG
ncbi:MAG: carbohydrate-binding domain-containing protein [Chitinophagaceae bacterium]|nr:carbohydrate-binding domain-containing protein [Chitinophagaceae bacterium]